VVEGEAAPAGVAAQVVAIGGGGVGLEQVKFQHGWILLFGRNLHSQALYFIIFFTFKVRRICMSDIAEIEAIVSSKGQVTLPAAMRAKLGITAGSHIHFELRGNELVIKPELPMSAYYGMLKDYDLGDIEPEKEPDREF
jgi:AbrB family looped-hinge helix DNA binding protein